MSRIGIGEIFKKNTEPRMATLSRFPHRGKRRRFWLFSALLLLTGAGVGTAVLCGAKPADKPAVSDLWKKDAPVLRVVSSKDLSALDISSRHAVLVRRDTGETLYRKAAAEPAYSASLTKMMTALVAIERLPDMETEVTLPESLFRRLLLQEASVAGFLPGERVSAADLLYAALLPSGADGAVGLALAAAGSEETFVEWMNQKAAELGMTDTHFVNVTGLHDPEQVTTANDMAKLLDAALANETFRTVFTAPRHLVPPTNRHPTGLMLSSTLFRRLDGTPEGVTILGGKTGYTSEAGLCLASLAEVEGRPCLLVTLGASGDNRTKPRHIEDALAIYAACREKTAFLEQAG